MAQTNGTKTRSIVYGMDGSGEISSYKDATGKTTTFTAAGGRVTGITTPAGSVISFGYDSTGRVTSLTRTNTSAGSPGDSVARLAYPSSSQTLLAGPDTDQSAPVSTVPHTTYTVDAKDGITKVTDEMGRQRATSYTADFDTLTATQGTGTTAGTTTNTYGANSGQSMTASQAPGGSTGQAAYANTAANTKYLPTSATDDAANKSLYTYNGSGNMLTAADATGAKATLTYNTDGTVASSLAPGNGTNATTYGYDGNHQLTGITPVTGSSLGARTLTYDPWGRVATSTDGAGNTVSYKYDANDRLITTIYSDYTTTLSYTYDDDGRVITRTDASGTTSYGYDQLGRLTSRSNTAGGGTITYGYDKASNLTSVTDTRGTTTYAFDASNVPTSMTYQYQGGSHVLAFGVDDQGRRTDSWMDTNADNSLWAAHTHTDYDTSGRVTHVLAEENSSGTIKPVLDLTYCHSAGSTAPTCPTTASADRSKIQWVMNNRTGAVTAYTYDKAGRLTKAVVTGGSSPTTYTYTYDSRGNRLTASGGTSTAQTRTYNAANQTTSTGYTYDGAGNLTADPNGTYTYNAARQMTTVTKSGTVYNYSYAGGSQNEITSETTPNGTYQAVYGRTDAQGLPVIEQYIKDSLTAYIDHDPVTGEPLMLRTASGKEALYVHDGTGNPAALITNDPYVAFAYDYDPYGTPTLTQVSGGNAVAQNPYTFKDGVQDRTTGWVKFGARWYNPADGRWTQQDTLDTPLSPANANRYAFAANDPINNADPLGMSFLGDFAKQFAPLVVGGAVESVGILVGLAFDSTGVGLGISAAFGCAAGVAAVAVQDRLNNSNSGFGGYAGACAGGLITGIAGTALIGSKTSN